ncbi:delta(3,5)-Delta(2,4)-dienoyl-CoA isomerase, peroxisomal [Cucurbita maxima]|uniref:Delta(3,5)-Delta(2,4)-dienoyl-CoA isomerase, peroxisomal n=1 Tax=Cucurbita maxima TaxID=3661 RepID=A0A6J1IPZ5_CUCMA|nr:delta(3,5)-Delta(2,4)-dienoyl-CoA isomerase, peroxisomal [Cucurbita maxima]
MEDYKSIKIERQNPNSGVFHLRLHRPSHYNTLTTELFGELRRALSSLDQNPDVRVIILSGSGKHFCAGIDLKSTASNFENLLSSERGRAGERLRREVKAMQDSITAIEECRKPVIACIHGGCIGGGVDMATACDLRYCTAEAVFSVKEVNLAITADLGTLQRLPGIVGFGKAVELALTGREFSGLEAKELGLVSATFASKMELENGVIKIAEEIASKSPLAVVGTKAVLLKSRDLTVEQGLDYVATWNSGTLLSADLKEAISARAHKRNPAFSKL